MEEIFAVEWFRKSMELWLSEQLIMERTKKGERSALENFLRYCNGSKPTRQLLIDWIMNWKGKDNTLQNYASTMRRFFEWLGNEGMYRNIGHGLRNYSRHQYEHTKLPLTETEVSRLLEHLEFYNQPCGRDKCILLLMLNCALRCCEVVRARIGDIFRYDGRVFLKVQGKGHVYPDAKVLLTDYLARRIEYYIAARPGPKDDESEIFLTLEEPYKRLTERRLSKICKLHLDAVGLLSPDYSTHSFRHTAATVALTRGASEDQVSRMLRHVDPRTTRLYTKFVDRMKNPAEKYLDFKAPEGVEEKVIPLRRA